MPEEQEHLTPGKNNPIQNQTDISKQSKEQNPETVPFLVGSNPNQLANNFRQETGNESPDENSQKISTLTKSNSITGLFVIHLQPWLWL